MKEALRKLVLMSLQIFVAKYRVIPVEEKSGGPYIDPMYMHFYFRLFRDNDYLHLKSRRYL